MDGEVKEATEKSWKISGSGHFCEREGGQWHAIVELPEEIVEAVNGYATLRSTLDSLVKAGEGLCGNLAAHSGVNTSKAAWDEMQEQLSKARALLQGVNRG